MNNTSVFELQQQLPLDEKLTSLISKCSEADEGALAELYMLTSSSLFALQARILGMSFVAERALHDTYLRIWLKSPEYSEKLGSPMPWLTSIARNHALNLKRARRVAREAESGLDHTTELEAEYIDSAFLNNNPESRPLKLWVDGLDKNTGDAIIRAYLDGWSLEELSAAYNKPLDSLRESIHAAMLSMGELT